MRHSLPRDWLLLMAAAAVLLLVPALLADHFSYNRWDNYEYFTPMLSEVHTHILSGRIPRINFHQHLGEPLMANTQAAPFYPFYSLAVAVVNRTGLSLDHLMTTVVAVHMPFALAGVFFLLRHIGVRAWLAFLLAVSGASSGYLQAHSITWIFMFPVYTWLAWSVLGLIWVIERSRPAAGAALLSGGMVSIALIGHGQMTVYSWLFIALLGLTIAHYHGGGLRSAIRLLPPAAIALLLAAPALLPSTLFISETARSATLSLPAFHEGAAQPAGLVGMISPLFRLWGGYLTAESAFGMYQGVHVFVFLVAVAWLRFTRAPVAAGAAADLHLPVAAVLVPTLVMFMFALGPHLFVYRLTYSIPIWSSFRWPHKFLLLVNWGLLVSAGVLAERYLRVAAQQRRRMVLLSLVVLAGTVIGLVLAPSPHAWKPSGLTVLLTSVAILAALPWADSRRIGLGVAGLGVLSAVGSTAFYHELNLKRYDEAIGTYTPQRLGIDPGYRVMPIHGDSRHPHRMHQFNLFHAATANGYWSLTGTAHPLVPLTYTQAIRLHVDGRIIADQLERLLPSHLLRSWNVRYAVVGRSDEAGRELLEESGFRSSRALEDADIYETTTHLPRVRFSPFVVPDTGEVFEQGLIEGELPLHAVTGRHISESQAYAVGRVLRSRWDATGVVDIDVDVPEAGFLVVSLLHTAGWTATVDGRRAAVHEVNRSIMGIEVPAGARSVVLRYRIRGLPVAGLLAGAGLLLGAGMLWVATSTDAVRVRTAPRRS